MPIIHTIGNLLLVLLFGVLGYVGSRKRPIALAFMILAVLLGGLGLLVKDQPDLFLRFFPFPDLLFYTNLYPFAVSLLIFPALQFAKDRKHTVRLSLLCGALFASSLIGYRSFLLPFAEAGEPWIDENQICRRTSLSTCSCAAMVTLLKHYEIPATEAELIKLAYTKEGVGTNLFGVYRALSLKVKEKPEYEVQIKKLPIENLPANQPALISVGLPGHGNSSEALTFGEQFQWEPGLLHHVVYLGPDPDKADHVLIAEPDFGLESWSQEHFQYLYRGYAVYLSNH